MAGSAGSPAGRFRCWAATADAMGSPLYAHLFDMASRSIEEGGPLAGVLQPYAGEPPGRNLPLRVAAQVHRWVLLGQAPELAPYYPSVGGPAPPPGAWAPFEHACVERRDELRRRLAHHCQHNEVGRCAALLGGFLLVARETGLPMRILEVGASGGLHLRWDHYRAAWWLPRLFAVPPPLDGDARVVERRGCDVEPVDPTTTEGAITLKSAVWADRVENHRMLDDAIAISRRVPAPVDRADAADWLPERLAAPVPDVATVVFHSVVATYPDEESLRRMGRALAEAAAAATPRAPLAWLRFELPMGWERTANRLPRYEVRLSTWPGGDDRLLALADGWGDDVRWVA